MNAIAISLQSVSLTAALLLLSAPPPVSAQPGNNSRSTRTGELPEAPAPAFAPLYAQAQGAPAAQTSAQSDGQGSQGPGQQPAKETRQEKAKQEVKEEEHQRVEGIVPTFNVTYHHDAVPLSPAQKAQLSLRSAIDPFAFASAFLEAGYHEAANDLTGFPWGAKGYFERSGAGYLDTLDTDLLSTCVLPIIFRQDPRYFRMGPAQSVTHRVFYSLATTFVAKSDRNGKWGPNYGNLLGAVGAGALSHVYYPSSNNSFGLLVSTAMIQIAGGTGGTIFNEFWPDISRKIRHRDPTHGLDARMRAQEKAKKKARWATDRKEPPTNPK